MRSGSKNSLTCRPGLSIFPSCMRSNRPKIGITLSETGESDSYRWPARKRFDYVKREYYESILAAGGMPVLLPNANPPSAIDDIIDQLDGLLLTGGGDLHPQFYDQAPISELSDSTSARDNLEQALVLKILERHRPVLGICRGHQVLNVALGGTLYQDLTCFPSKTQPHADPQQTGKIFHDVTVEPESRMMIIPIVIEV